MFRKYGSILGAFALSGSLCFAANFHYTDVAELLSDNALTVSNAVIQRHIEDKNVFPEKEKKIPFQCYIDAQYAYHKSKNYHTHSGIGLVGCDLSYRNPILRRDCELGLFAGGFRDRSHPNIVDNKSGFLGYSVHFHFRGFNFAGASSINLGTSHVETDYVTPEKHFTSFTRHNRAFHNQFIVNYLWDINSFAIGPRIGIVRNYIKQNKAQDLDQHALHYKTTEGIFGIVGEMDKEKYYAQMFLGVGRRFRFHTDGGTIIRGPVMPSIEIPVKNRFIATGNIHYAIAPRWLINAHFSGNFNRDFKTCSLGLILNHVF